MSGANINNPNAELNLTGYGWSNYVSKANIGSDYGYSAINGIYDHNNGNPVGGQMAITRKGVVVKRTFANGTWTAWRNDDDPAIDLKRNPLSNTVDFNQFAITQDSNGKYILHFYKDSIRIASIVSA